MILPSDVSGSTAIATRQYDPCPMILLFLWVLALTAALPGFFAPDATAPVAPTRASVNPNVAPWWELTILPRIGRRTARRIVRFRESAGNTSSRTGDNVAFGHPADLAQVRGIGPRTLQRIGPYLCFEEH
jgi:hypothetical protein